MEISDCTSGQIRNSMICWLARESPEPLRVGVMRRPVGGRKIHGPEWLIRYAERQPYLPRTVFGLNVRNHALHRYIALRVEEGEPLSGIHRTAKNHQATERADLNCSGVFRKTSACNGVSGDPHLNLYGHPLRFSTTRGHPRGRDKCRQPTVQDSKSGSFHRCKCDGQAFVRRSPHHSRLRPYLLRALLQSYGYFCSQKEQTIGLQVATSPPYVDEMRFNRGGAPCMQKFDFRGLWQLVTRAGATIRTFRTTLTVLGIIGHFYTILYHANGVTTALKVPSKDRWRSGASYRQIVYCGYRPFAVVRDDDSRHLIILNLVTAFGYRHFNVGKPILANFRRAASPLYLPGVDCDHDSQENLPEGRDGESRWQTRLGWRVRVFGLRRCLPPGSKRRGQAIARIRGSSTKPTRHKLTPLPDSPILRLVAPRSQFFPVSNFQDREAAKSRSTILG